MGEYADMMLEGGACVQCGEAFLDGDDDGFPRLCGGCEQEKTAAHTKNDLDWFSLRNREKSYSVLHGVITREKNNYAINTYSGPIIDKTGKYVFFLGWNTKPESDFGKYKGHRLAVRLDKDVPVERAENAIRKALGWELVDNG